MNVSLDVDTEHKGLCRTDSNKKSVFNILYDLHKLSYKLSLRIIYFVNRRLK